MMIIVKIKALVNAKRAVIITHFDFELTFNVSGFVNLNICYSKLIILNMAQLSFLCRIDL